MAKTPYVALGPDSGVGPTGLSDAVTGAVLRLAELTSPDIDEVRRLLNDEYARIDCDSHDRVTLLDGWFADQVSIGGISHRADSRRLEAAWATVVDLPDVAVAISGPASMAMRQIQLSNCRRGSTNTSEAQRAVKF